MTRTSMYVVASQPEAPPLGAPGDAPTPPGVEPPTQIEVLRRLVQAGEYEVDPEFVAMRIMERAGI